MHAEKLLHRWLLNVLRGMHRKRVLALGAVMTGAFHGRRLTVTSLGRSLRGGAKEKHNIKRADRLLSNKHLHSERLGIYEAVSRELLGAMRQPVILIDWSDIDGRREFFLLRASTPVKGRSLTIYEEVHGRETREKRATHWKFLKQLQGILPEGTTPIIITDAGFRTLWFKQVRALGWDFVGRVRNRDKVKCTEKYGWNGAKSLYRRAKNVPILFHDVQLTESNPLECSLVLFKSKAKGRVHLGKMGGKKRNGTSLVSSKRAREPWLLATSLNVSADRIVRLYALRMQIEESFRDLKCSRYGLSLYQNATYKIERLKILVLVGSLTATFAWLLGKAAKLAGKHRQFQANTVTHTSVLSLVFVGIRIFHDWRIRISATLFKSAQTQISSIIQKYAYV